MLSRSLVEQVKCRWREFRREPSAFFWVMFMPVLFMVGLGFAFSTPHPETYGVGYVRSLDGGEWLESMESALAADPQIKLRRAPLSELQRLVMRGEVAVILKIPASHEVVYEFDATNPEAVRAQRHLDDTLQRASGRQDPVKTGIASVRVEGGRYVDFLIPGLLGLSIMTSSLFGVGMTIVSNRKENVLKRYLATPLRAYEYIISHLCGRLIVLAAEFLAVMVTAWLIFRFQVYGSWLALVVFTVLGAGAFTSIALLCAARTKSIPMISGLTNLISLPMMMLSGVFFSKNNFPDWLRRAVDFLPLTALNDGLRKIALEGLSLHSLSFESAVLSAYLIIPALITARLFKWF
jgi:ABC-2 type transport system permease protein